MPPRRPRRLCALPHFYSQPSMSPGGRRLAPTSSSGPERPLVLPCRVGRVTVTASRYTFSFGAGAQRRRGSSCCDGAYWIQLDVKILPLVPVHNTIFTSILNCVSTLFFAGFHSRLVLLSMPCVMQSEDSMYIPASGNLSER